MSDFTVFDANGIKSVIRAIQIDVIAQRGGIVADLFAPGNRQIGQETVQFLPEAQPETESHNAIPSFKEETETVDGAAALEATSVWAVRALGEYSKLLSVSPEQPDPAPEA